MISSIYNQFTSFGIKITSNIYDQFITFNAFLEYLNDSINIDDTDRCEIVFNQDKNNSLIAKYTGDIKNNKFNSIKSKLQIFGSRWPIIYVGGFKDGLFDGYGELQYYGKDRFEPSNDCNSDWNNHEKCDFFYKGNFKDGLFYNDGEVITAYLSYPNYVTLLKWDKGDIKSVKQARRYRCVYDENGICSNVEYIEPISHHVLICDDI